MRERIRKAWDKHEIWISPVMFIVCLAVGIQIGIRIGTNEAQSVNARTISDQAEQLVKKDAVIADKDSRLRQMQDLQLKGNGQALSAATSSSEAAAKAAQAAAQAAAAAEAAVSQGRQK